jgi:hypothetical protein
MLGPTGTRGSEVAGEILGLDEGAAKASAEVKRNCFDHRNASPLVCDPKIIDGTMQPFCDSRSCDREARGDAHGQL